MIQRILDSIRILPTLANAQPPRFVESARKAWRGLQAVPEVAKIAQSVAVEMEKRNGDSAVQRELATFRTRGDSLENLFNAACGALETATKDLADSRKHVASLEQQLAAVCGGLEAEKAAHMEAKRCCDDAILPLSRTIDERNQARAEVANLHETLLVAKRDAWGDGFEAGVAFATSPQSTPGGIPIDPPRNPYV